MEYHLKNDNRSNLDNNRIDIFDEENLNVGQERIVGAFDRNDWMTPDEFGDYLREELNRIYEKE